MKYFIYKINIDNQIEKKARSVIDLNKPIDVIKLMAWEEYKAQEFELFLLTKETYDENFLLDVKKWKIEKAEFPNLVDNNTK